MKNLTFLAFIFPIMLVGCSVVGAVYDPNEYAAFTNIAHAAYVAKQTCGDDEQIKRSASQIKHATSYAVFFAKHKQYNKESFKIAREIDNLAAEFVSASENKMSKTYCEIKVNSIQEVAEIAMQSTTSKRRQ